MPRKRCNLCDIPAWLHPHPGCPANPPGNELSKPLYLHDVGGCLYRNFPSLRLHEISLQRDPFPGSGKVDSLTYPLLSNGAVILSAVCDLPDESAQILGASLGGTTDIFFGTNTPIPGGMGNFETFSNTAFWNGKLLFSGTGSGDQSGIYTGMPGVLTKIADTNTPVPEANGATFVEFNPGSYQMGINSTGDVSFTGTTYAESGPITGVYRSSGNTLTRVADTTQYVPGSTVTFDRLSNPTLTSTSTVFLGTGGSGTSTVGGLYESDFASGTLSCGTRGAVDPRGKNLRALLRSARWWRPRGLRRRAFRRQPRPLL